MSRLCQVTGKTPLKGHHVSHANNKTKRFLLPNLQVKKFWLESKKRWIKLKVSAKAIRIINKKGLEAFLEK